MEKTFQSALESFIIKMEELPAVLNHPGVGEAMREVCEILRIAKVNVILAETPGIPVNTVSGERIGACYDTGDADESRVYSYIKTTGEGNRAEYYIYPIKGSPVWTEEEKYHLQSFVTVLYVFHGRSRVMTLVERLTYRDAELHMYNLNYFMQEIGQLFAQKRVAGYIACRFNIRGLGAVNRQLGRNGGTRMMRHFVKGLELIIADHGVVGRMGGDNFAAFFKQELMPPVTEYLSGTVLETGQPGMPKIRMAATAGYYPIEVNCPGPNVMMDRAIVAYENARHANVPYTVYDEQTQRRDENKKWVESNFESALKQEEFLVFYQPKVDLHENKLYGAEALCRWRHEGELIPPGRFIPVLEQSNRICILDFYVLEHVCRDIRRWLDEGLSVVNVSVNISRVHMGNEDLAEQILSIIDKYQVPHEYIEIELTETTTDVNFSELKKVVGKLNEKGIHLDVDDFGVGYSSLNLIRELPWSVLKIDKSFLPEESDHLGASKKIMLKSVIGMAHELGLECVVEGTETKEQIELLRYCDCRRVQGFYFDKPLPVEEFEIRLRNPIYTDKV